MCSNWPLCPLCFQECDWVSFTHERECHWIHSPESIYATQLLQTYKKVVGLISTAQGLGSPIHRLCNIASGLAFELKLTIGYDQDRAAQSLEQAMEGNHVQK